MSKKRTPSFDHVTTADHVLFGPGRLTAVKETMTHLGGTRALVLSTRRTQLAEQVSALLGNLSAGIHPYAVPHVPQKAVDHARQVAADLQVDFIIAPGGGSTIGLAKGIAKETGLPILAIPTTYSGSEMTQIWGISQNGRKTTGRDPQVKPKAVIYDPELLISLPAHLSLTSGINAMAHAAEALYAENNNPIAHLMAEESLRQLYKSLPKVIANPNNISARSASLYGAWLAASVLDTVGMALHHKLCHTLGGSFGLPHAQTHTVILPYALSYNQQHAPEAIKRMAKAFDCAPNDVTGTIYDLSKSLGGPTSLEELGFKLDDIPQASELATQAPYYNPRPVTREGIQALLTQAHQGIRP